MALEGTARPFTGETTMQLDRETLAAAVVATGGAWMLGSAIRSGKGGRWNTAQMHGLLFSGAGFLMSAAAARWLQHTGRIGIFISLVGTVLAMRGMYLLLRERAVRRSDEKTRTPE